jgi:hypothetical protein
MALMATVILVLSTETRQDRLAMGRAAIMRREDTAAYASKNSHMR